jgi:3,4-dihydroxy-2-butanone 4-phosphate synthase
MEEQALSVALKAMRKGQCIAILDLESKEVKIDLFFVATFIFPLSLRTQRTKARGELYISMVHEVAFTFDFLFIGEVPLPTHNCSSSSISNKLPSFPLFEVFA